MGFDDLPADRQAQPGMPTEGFAGGALAVEALKIASSRPFGMPGPSSSTVNCAIFPCCSRVSLIVPPAGENDRALPTRLSTT